MAQAPLRSFFSRSLRTSFVGVSAPQNLGAPRFASGVTFKPLTFNLGAEVEGVDLTKFTPEEFKDIREGLFKYGVIFFRNQDISKDDHINLARSFGTPEIHPIVKGLPSHPEILEIIKEPTQPTRFGEVWHSDNSFEPVPTGESILVSRELPTYGNDTVFAGMHLIYESLSDTMKEMLGSLKAIHSAKKAYSVDEHRVENFKGDAKMKYQESESLYAESIHPVVRTHPYSGRKAIFVNQMFTLRFEGMTEEESAPLLQYLTQLPNRQEVQCRFRWYPGSIAIWDNRVLQHIAIGDGADKVRRMQRVTCRGEKPV